MKNENILVTGGAGYIGSHTAVELISAGFTPIIVDNFSNAGRDALTRLEKITGKKIKLYDADIRDRKTMDKIFDSENISAVIHFAGLKAVGESVAKPLEYYDNNIYGTLVLLESMRAHNVKRIIFSSSATVYGDPEKLPLDENCRLSTTNPYGSTKLYIEQILKDLFVSDKTFDITILRYFNPVGAHKSALIGEDPKGIPNNLTPFIAKVAGGELECVNVFGNDYNTPDGTGVRDYIHVVDLSIGHILALQKSSGAGVKVYNLGTGRGYSVLEVIAAFEKACGKKIPYKICPRRPGDIAACYANPEKAKKELGFTAKYGIDEMCDSAWKWQNNKTK